MTQVKSWTPVPLIKTTADFFAGKGIHTPRLDAEVMLCHVLGLKNRIDLYTGFERPLTEREISVYRESVRRRAAREPVSHILGYRDFMGIRFKVTADVLTPRPETEILVERGMRLLDAQNSKELKVLDIGTGSGCIAVSLAAMCPAVRIVAIDISEAALRVAAENAQAAGVSERICFRTADLFSACEPGEAFDLIVSNPPYVAEDDCEVWPEVRDFEPEIAVFSPGDPISFYKRIASEVENWLNPACWLLMEIGAGQAERVNEVLVQTTLLQELEIIEDYAGIPRVLAGRKPEC